MTSIERLLAEKIAREMAARMDLEITQNLSDIQQDDYDTVADGLVRALDALERVERLLMAGGEHRVHDALAVIAEVRE